MAKVVVCVRSVFAFCLIGVARLRRADDICRLGGAYGILMSFRAVRLNARFAEDLLLPSPPRVPMAKAVSLIC